MSLPLFHSGCDGKNYSNACDAYSQGVSVSRTGECGAIPEEGGVVIAVTTSTPAPVAVPGGSYCTYSPNMTCYESGWPSCCAEEASCPEEKPACEIPLVGSSYCTYGPNTTCYEDGWPSCCGSDNTTCPEEQPPCEVTGAVNILGSAEETAPSAASVLSTFSFVTAVVAMTVVPHLFI